MTNSCLLKCSNFDCKVRLKTVYFFWISYWKTQYYSFILILVLRESRNKEKIKITDSRLMLVKNEWNSHAYSLFTICAFAFLIHFVWISKPKQSICFRIKSTKIVFTRNEKRHDHGRYYSDNCEEQNKVNLEELDQIFSLAFWSI